MRLSSHTAFAHLAVVAVVVTLVALTGCADDGTGDATTPESRAAETPADTEGEPMEEPTATEGAEQLLLEGRLTDEGVECPAFRSDEDDELYTLTGDLGGFGPGDRVRIVAVPVQMSTCMQGITVRIVEISAIDEEPGS